MVTSSPMPDNGTAAAMQGVAPLTLMPGNALGRWRIPYAGADHHCQVEFNADSLGTVSSTLSDRYCGGTVTD